MRIHEAKGLLAEDGVQSFLAYHAFPKQAERQVQATFQEQAELA
jgi:hypothetical protein